MGSPNASSVAGLLQNSIPYVLLIQEFVGGVRLGVWGVVLVVCVCVGGVVLCPCVCVCV